MATVYKVVKQVGNKLLSTIVIEPRFQKRYDGRIVNRCLAFETLEQARRFKDEMDCIYTDGFPIYEAECQSARPVTSLGCGLLLRDLRDWSKHPDLFFDMGNCEPPRGTVLCNGLRLVRRIK